MNNKDLALTYAEKISRAIEQQQYEQAIEEIQNLRPIDIADAAQSDATQALQDASAAQDAAGQADAKAIAALTSATVLITKSLTPCIPWLGFNIFN